MPSKMTEPIGAPPERWIVITGKIFKRSTNVKFSAADRLPVLHLIQRHRRDIAPLGCFSDPAKHQVLVSLAGLI